MKKLKYILILVIGLFSYNLSIAQENISAASENNQEIESNLDSLLNLWYVKNSIKSTDVRFKMPDNELKISDVSDSVLIARLGAIPSLIDLPYNQVIRRYIEVYTRRKSAPILLGLANYYFPMFEEILDKYDLPIELKYLPIIESALNPRALSRAGATGLWQFMYGTGRMYQLEINSFVDERRDPFSSTVAASQFLSHLYNVYGDWTLVIAAYNCGPGNVNKAIKRAGGKRDYWEIYPYLPRETRNYVPAFIGAAYMLNYYDKHDIVPLDIKMPMMTDTIMVYKKLHLQQISDVLKISVDELRDLNPQYKKDIIPATGQTYPLRLPVEFSVAFLDMQDSIYLYKDSVFFNPRTVVMTPTKNNKKEYFTSSYESEYAAPSTENMTKFIYPVQANDNLGLISDWYDVKLADLKSWNNIRGVKINVGQKLVVYVPNKKAYKYKNISTASFEEKNKIAIKTVAENKQVNPDFVNDPNYEYYIVQQNDNLYDIAKKKGGVSYLELVKINNFSSNDIKNLKPGQIIKIKKKG